MNFNIPSLVFLSPFITLIILSIFGATKLNGNEFFIKRLVAISQSISFLATVFVAFIFLLIPEINIVNIVDWHLFSFGEHSVRFILNIDRISIWFVLMATILANIVGIFSQNYLHRDVGFFRFFFLITLFLNGVIIIFAGANFQIIFMGWELVGITSALLISFFNARRATIEGALHAFWTYRVSDIGILTASSLMASVMPHFTFSAPAIPLNLPEKLVYLVPFLLLLSAMGKSAQYPFSSWLPKAMEGPTSSSAIFYGGLSIHAGVYLLLRLSIEFSLSPLVLIIIALVGAFSAIYGALLSQVQSDVKSALAYASLSQVGLLFIEIGLGLHTLVIIHCLGHAFLRTYQILKSASVIHEYVDFEDAHQFDQGTRKASLASLFIPKSYKAKLFSIAFDLALRDASSRSKIIVFIEALSKKLEKAEDRWLSFICKVDNSPAYNSTVAKKVGEK